MNEFAGVSPSTDRIRVLHVDDAPDLGELVAAFLERADDRLTVETAASVEEGLDRLAEETFDCVVSDYEMPERTGIDFLETIRSTRPDLPFILYTGRGSEEVASEAITAGATDYLQKESGTDHYAVLANRIANVVERDRARTSMNEIQHLFAELVDRTDDVLWLFSRDWSELVFITDSYETVYGQSLATLREDSRAFLDAVHPEDRERVERSMEALSNGRAVDVEYRVNEAEGYGRYVWVKGEPITDAEGRVTHVGGSTRDITYRRTREEELARAERQYEAVFEDPNVLVGLLTPDGTVLDVNRTAMEYIDADREAVLGTPFREAPWWGDDDSLREDVQRWVDRAASGEYVPFEAEIVGADGHRTVSGVFRPVTNDDGEVTEIIVSDRDITDRRTRERVLREMYEITADPELSFDEQVRGLLALGRAQLGVGYGTLSRIRGEEYRFEVVDAADDSISEGDIVPLSATNCEIAAATEKTLVLENIERDAPEETDRAGFTEWGISCYLGTPVFVDDGVYGTFCFYDTEPRREPFSEWEVTLVDLMSRWVSSELQRQRANERLQRQNGRLERFASIVSHDLRNPLSVAMGSVELAEQTEDLDHLAPARRSLKRMNGLIDDLLMLARSGDVIDDLSAVELASVVEQSWMNVPTADATLRVETEQTVRADGTRLRQLFENLVRNAVEHGARQASGRSAPGDSVEHGSTSSETASHEAESGGRSVTVTVGDLPDGFYVADDGPGIPPENRDRVFEHGYSTDRDGTGYGLAIVREIADAHGWEIRVTESAEGGARFDITGVDVVG
ncbi:response regulator [Halogeometricum sp. S1BR25-6]|uniref:histidine kinase n=1 Tax=Halogeometricum salsisoli TaxID=2950536 RepID=A0ABU2GEG8_9EURY|nr:response regulator [Halogeometricum sp. S1BR25-6]MDS0299200.1 response regulator [Halogeometricum sp. S1BR25-6]